MKDPVIQVLVTIHGQDGKVSVHSGHKEFPKEMSVEKAAQYALAEALEKITVRAEGHRRD